MFIRGQINRICYLWTDYKTYSLSLYKNFYPEDIFFISIIKFISLKIKKQLYKIKMLLEKRLNKDNKIII